MKILLIEDDECVSSILIKALTPHNYNVETITDGQAGLELAKAFNYDLLLVDVMLPTMDGISLCHQLRMAGFHTPIMILTAKNSARDRVMGLEMGADDYIVKPFVVAELIARIRALMRRGREILPTVLTWENLQLNSNTREVSYGGKRLLLTPKEYSLLELFLRNPHKVFSRTDLLNCIWSSSEFPGEEAVTTQVKGLRQKLKAVGMTANLIETIYGLGYRLKEENEEQDLPDLPEKACVSVKHSWNKEQTADWLISNKQQISIPSDYTYPKSLSQQISSSQKNCQDEAKVMDVVAKMWDDFQQNHLEQHIELFEQVLVCLSNHNADNNLLTEAQSKAHRLAGSLGCYGLPEGSKVAREMELTLKSLAVWEQSVSLRLKRLEYLIQSLKKILHKQATTPVKSSISMFPR
jgi:DNA-binding response OmpR family regulator/HPt (histidine-containing phosphotransfer) domain-containing protein